MTPLLQKFDNDFIDKKISIGSIISIDIDNIDHPKWNIILDITDNKCLVASVFINTEINFKHINSKELQDLQIKITSKNISKLDHNSVIDCSDLFENNYETYKTALINNSIKYKGILPDDILKEVIGKLRTSPKIKRKLKKRYKRIFSE